MRYLGEVSPLFTPRPNINFLYYLGLLHTTPHNMVQWFSQCSIYKVSLEPRSTSRTKSISLRYLLYNWV
jgi:hypothetical protein